MSSFKYSFELNMKSTSFNLDFGSLKGPAGKHKPFPKPLAPSKTAISTSLVLEM